MTLFGVFIGTVAEIKAVADAWGVPFRGKVDLWALNKAAEHRGAAPFEIAQRPSPKPKHTKIRCLCCRVLFKSEDLVRNRLCEPCSKLPLMPWM